MEDDLSMAFLIAKTLIRDKSFEELSRLQITLQAISSLVSAELGRMRLSALTPETPRGASK